MKGLHPGIGRCSVRRLIGLALSMGLILIGATTALTQQGPDIKCDITVYKHHPDDLYSLSNNFILRSSSLLPLEQFASHFDEDKCASGSAFGR